MLGWERSLVSHQPSKCQLGSMLTKSKANNQVLQSHQKGSPKKIWLNKMKVSHPKIGRKMSICLTNRGEIVKQWRYLETFKTIRSKIRVTLILNLWRKIILVTKYLNWQRSQLSSSITLSQNQLQITRWKSLEVTVRLLTRSSNLSARRSITKFLISGETLTLLQLS